MGDEWMGDDLERAKPNNRPRYDYKSDECGHFIERDFRETTFVGRCDECGETRLFKRTYTAPFIKPMMHSHFNHAVAKEISDMGQFRDELKRKSEYASNNTNMEHNYQPLEYGDHQAFKATGEGIYESNRYRSKVGAPLLKEIPGEV